MPRNSSGVYSLPESPFVPGTTIESAPVNSDFSDIATALTGSLPVNGSAPMTGQFQATDGSLSAPSISFDNATGTGWYLSDTNEVSYVANGVLAVTYNADLTVDFASAIRVGNVSVSNANYLDWYEEGTFTPVLSFGGASVGITYETQVARYTRIGNVVFVSIEIDITSKGSSTGDAFVSGLPYAAGTGRNGMPIFLVHSFSVPANFQTYEAFLETALSTLELTAYDEDIEDTITLQDTNFTNNSAFQINGFYFIG